MVQEHGADYETGAYNRARETAGSSFAAGCAEKGKFILHILYGQAIAGDEGCAGLLTRRDKVVQRISEEA